MLILTWWSNACSTDASAKAEASEMGDEGDLDAYMALLNKQSQTQDLAPIHRLQTKLIQLKKVNVCRNCIYSVKLTLVIE